MIYSVKQFVSLIVLYFKFDETSVTSTWKELSFYIAISVDT